mmetsp:Transcript_22952/g.39356  ORF Transcript_22952/g.39356 Transcript_22952/m.39356 type:complete len:463 (+) Transcript_22952:59-1447(+)
MLDINLFRAEKGGNPDLVRESQKRRNGKTELVDKVIELDQLWRNTRFQLDQLKRDYGKLNKEVATKKRANENADDLIAQIKELDEQIKQMEEKEKELNEKTMAAVDVIGNIVHDSVPISNNEDDNRIERIVGHHRKEGGLYNHIALLQMIDAVDTERGTAVAGNRGYYLKGNGVMLALAVIHHGLSFLVGKGFTPLYTPFFMKKEVMREVAQLEQFDEELYKVTGEGDDKYLIATSEQTICGFHRGEWLPTTSLPLKYAGYSTCFRKEVGRHGQDTLGIFRIHQFEKIEQFCITAPDKSWEMQEEMIATAEAFYTGLGIPYRIVNIVSGALNNAAAKKYDLEAWFPGSAAYRELVSCSNCTDYQSRNLEVRYGATKKLDQKTKEYVHMLNATLCAVQRFLCCLVENHQTPTGINIPPPLQSYMGGQTFLPFIKEAPKGAKTTAAPKDATPELAAEAVGKLGV